MAGEVEVDPILAEDRIELVGQADPLHPTQQTVCRLLELAELPRCAPIGVQRPHLVVLVEGPLPGAVARVVAVNDLVLRRVVLQQNRSERR